MNKKQTKKLDDLAGQLSAIQQEVQNVLDEEQADFDGRSERWQESEKGQIAEAMINELETAIESIEAAFTSLNSFTDTE